MDATVIKVEANFYYLPLIVLVKIFGYCSVKQIGKLACVCKKFQYVTMLDDIWIPMSKSAIGTNMYHSTMIKRSRPILNHRDRIRISRLWSRNENLPCYAIFMHQKCMPWLQLTSDFLFLSSRNQILRWVRFPEGVCIKDSSYVKIPHQDDVSKFIVSDGKTISAGRDGTISYWNNIDNKMITFLAHSKDVLGIDFESDITVSCSKDHTIKLYKIDEDSVILLTTLDLKTRVLDVTFHDKNSFILCSTSGIKGFHPLQMYDTTICKRVSNFGEGIFAHGAGILCIYPEDRQTFLTCGYDTTVRLWDVRCPAKDVLQWMDMYDNSIYCVTSDHNVTIMSGAGRSGLVHVWDKRFANPVRMFYGKNSPVYSVAFDPCSLFSAFDTQVYHHSFLNLKL